MGRSRLPFSHRPFARVLIALVALLPIAAACGDDSGNSAANTGTAAPSSTSTASCAPDQMPAAVDASTAEAADTKGTTLTLVTHDSFAVSDGIFDQFEQQTGITVKVLQTGDAGALVSQAVLTAGNPVGDVLFGIDNTFLCHGLDAGVFTPYQSPALSDVPKDLQLDPNHLVTPIDVGDVCVNYSKSAFSAGKQPPTSLDDLTNPNFKDQFVTENPETSSPGFAFLLATIAKYGENGWEDYWKRLRDNGVQVTSGWEEAYNDSFGAGSGSRSIVTSYASSPAADVVYADPPRDESNIGVVSDACFRQIEFAGILRGTKHPEAAAKLVDFLLSPTFQNDIPLNMFVYPSSDKATLPDVFVKQSQQVANPYTLDPAAIEAGRAQWTDTWTQIVLR